MPVGISASDMELYLAIRTALIGSGIKDAQKEIKKIGQESVAATDRTATPAWKRMRGEMTNMLGPLTTIRMTVFRLRYAFLLTFGSIIAAVVSGNKELEKLDKTASDLGVSFNELSMARYGKVFDVVSIQQTSEAWRQVRDEITKLKMELAVATSKVVTPEKMLKNVADEARKAFLRVLFPAAPPEALDTLLKNTVSGYKKIADSTDAAAEASRKYTEVIRTMGDVQAATYFKMEDRIKQLSSSEGDYQRYALANTIERYKKEMQLNLNMTNEQREKRTAVITKLNALETDAINKKEQVRYLQLAGSMWGELSNTIQQAIGDSKEYGAVIKTMRLGEAIINTATAVTNALTTQPPWLGMALAATHAALGAAQVGIIAAQPMAKGGIVDSPTLAMIGEAGPEAVIPLSDRGSFGGDTYISIYAIDTQSFAEALRRNPDAITSIVQDNVKNNKNLRRTIRDGR